MAVSVAVVKKNVVGAQYEVIADVTFDSSYPTGGEPLAAAAIFDAAFGPGVVTSVHHVSSGSRTVPGSNIFHYDYTNSKMLAFVITTGVEVANTVDLSAAIVRIKARGGQVV